MAALSISSTLLGEIVLIALIAVVLFIIFKLGKTILKFFFGIIANSILGLIAILAFHYFLGFDIPINYATMVPTAIFGLPAVGTLVILRFFGIPL